MCTTCGCGTELHDHDHDHAHAHAHAHDHAHAHAHDHAHAHAHEPRVVTFERELLAKNARLADANRRALAGSKTAVLNLIGSPGAGKTALLESTIRALRDELALSVIEGDQATENDAKRIEKAGCKAVQINTGAGCHLDAEMVMGGLQSVAPAPGSVVFVENVGNLVCPALFDLGERAKVVVMSVTEGDDKPAKYPHVFRAAKLFVLTKVDLLPYVPFDVNRCVAFAREVNPSLEVIPVSALKGDGMTAWISFVRAESTRAKEASS